MSSVMLTRFEQAGICAEIRAISRAELDALDFGVIGFDDGGIVRLYNRTESINAGLRFDQVIGHSIFIVVAPCMNNYMVAQRFEDAAAEGHELDATIDYVLTLRMRPIRVKLRLVASFGETLRYVFIKRP